MFKPNTKYEILTNSGFEKFFGITVKEDSTLKITLKSGSNLECSENHKVKTNTGFVKACELVYGNLLDTKNGFDEVISVEKNSKVVKLYDPINVGKDHTYYSNGIVSHNCAFEGTGDTYIDGEILVQLKSNCSNDYDIKYNNRMRVWKEPQRHHDYVLAADPSIGRERDFSAFHIIDVYNGEQVAEFYSNRTPINEFAEIIAKEARIYNTAYVLTERNTIGANLIYFLKETFEYENLVMDENREIGIQVTQKNREQLLANMEDAIRSLRVKINSERLVNELLTFIIDPETGKIEADANCHDDLILAFAIAVSVFNDLRGSSLIERDSLVDLSSNNPSLVLSTKYKVATATGGISEEDLKWLIGK